MRDGEKETPARILQAADELLVEVGYDGVSMRAVAERAGVNKASVFYHFSSKAKLIEQVLERYYSAHLQALSRAFDAGGTVAERFHRLLDAYLDFIDENRRYPRLVQQQIAGSDAHHELVRRNLIPLFEWTIAALCEVAPEHGPTAARQLFATFSGIVINYYTLAPVIGAAWGTDPLGPEGLAERRAHVHWLVDTLLERLTAAPAIPAPSGPSGRTAIDSSSYKDDIRG